MTREEIANKLRELADEVDALPGPTPAQKAGFGVGDKAVVIKEDIFTVGSIVELYRDDGDDIPLWLLVSGDCKLSRCDGEPGDYEELENVHKLPTGPDHDPR